MPTKQPIGDIMKAYECSNFRCIAEMFSEDECFYKTGCKDCIHGKKCYWCNHFDSCAKSRENLKRQQEQEDLEEKENKEK